MLRIIYRVLMFQLAFFAQLAIARAQMTGDSLFVSKVVHTIHYNFLKSQKGSSPVFNGKVYNDHPKFKDHEHAYFQTHQYTIGSVVYNGIFYPELRLKYDILRDELVLLDDDQIDGIVLQPEYVDSFFIHGYQFINIKPEIPHKGIEIGYYNLLYKGESLSLLVKRAKEVTEKIDQQIEKVISQKETYYLLKNSIYQPIKSKNDLLKLLRRTDDKNQEYIKANKLNFGKDFEHSVLSIVRFNDATDK